MYYGNEEWDFLDCEQECDRVCSIHDPRPNKVLERLFIGCQDSARNQLCLRNLKISHIVDMTGSKLHFDEFQYHSVHSLEDSQRADLLSVIEGCVSFIEEGMCLGSGVLVHCAAGVSRSAAVVAAYLMKREGMAVEEAVKTVQSARRIAQPNSGFPSTVIHVEGDGIFFIWSIQSTSFVSTSMHCQRVLFINSSKVSSRHSNTKNGRPPSI
eukprot:TRINITY_DN1097_c0_g1_i1.p1 TRINITY_DN1097_c0_g1~~TRINITY_DN1097_c0_g1_i1.p1  ORF type:complete len:211 (+),score=18.58 TRINITY_DN1097_c0_g1_i1:190-822(+)